MTSLISHQEPQQNHQQSGNGNGADSVPVTSTTEENSNNYNSKWKKRLELKLRLLGETSSKETFLSLAKWIEFNRIRMISDFVPVLLHQFTICKDTDNPTRQGLYLQLVHELLLDERDSNSNSGNGIISNNNGNVKKKSKWDRYYDLRVSLGERVLIPIIDEMILILVNSSSQSAAINLHEKIVSYIKEWDELNVFETPTLIFQLKRRINVSKQQQRKKQQLQQQQNLEPQQVSVAAAADVAAEASLVVSSEDKDKDTVADTATAITPSKRPVGDDGDRATKKKKESDDDNDADFMDVDAVANDVLIATTTSTPVISSETLEASPVKKGTSPITETGSSCNDFDDTLHIPSANDHEFNLDTDNGNNVETPKSPCAATETDPTFEDNMQTSDKGTATGETGAVSDPTTTSTKSIITSTTSTSDTIANDELEGSTSVNSAIVSSNATDDMLASRRNSMLTSTNIAGTPYDFESTGIAAEQIDTRDIIDHCKAIATLQIARDLRNDSAVQLSSLLSSMPEDIQKTYTTKSTTTDEGGTSTSSAIELPEVQARDFSIRINERILQMDVAEQISNVQTFNELIVRQQQARRSLLKLLIQSRCIFGSESNAVAYYSTSTVMEQLQQRKSVLLDSMELEGLDVDEENNDKKNKDMESEQLLPLSWFQPTSTTSTPSNIPLEEISNNENDAKRQKVS